MNVEEWREHNDRPKWVQLNREEIEAASGKSLPRGLPELRTWLRDNKGAVTKGLKEDNE